MDHFDFDTERKLTEELIFKAFVKEGICITAIPALNDTSYRDSLELFLDEPDSYRLFFLQKRYNRAFDGYSYQGQVDSTNQHMDDLLHTFVLSKFSSTEHFPEAFKLLLESEWDQTVQKIMGLERALCKHMGEPFVVFYDQHIGHMLSANYYPPVSQFKKMSKGNNRLSSHPDASFVTVFPFGIPKGFSYQTPSGDWKTLDTCNQVVLFPGYLLQLCSNGLIKALEHRVVLPDNANEERYSFAFFSLPRPGQCFQYPNSENNEWTTTEDYIKAYLALF